MLYALVMIMVMLAALLFTVFAFRASAIFGLLTLVIGDPLYIIISLALWRVWSEGAIVFFASKSAEAEGDSVSEHEDPRYADREPRSAHDPDLSQKRYHAEIVPRPGGVPEPDQTRVIQVPPSGGDPPGRRRTGRGMRSLLIMLVPLLVLAVLAFVLLVARKPASSQPTAEKQTSTPTPSAAATSAAASSAEATSAEASSPAASPASSPASSPSGTGASPTSSSTAAVGGGPGSPIANLSALTVLSDNYVSNLSNGPEQIGAVTYQDSVGFTCDTFGNNANFVYDVAGYKFLTTVVGVPSDATNAAGNAMTITFFKDGATQLSAPAEPSAPLNILP